MTMNQAKFARVTGSSKPDEFDPSLGLPPPPTFVVSRAPNGTTVSMYGDAVWYLWPYAPHKHRSQLRFLLWNSAESTPRRDAIMAEIRWLIFMLIYLPDGSAAKPSTLNSYLTLLRDIARYADPRSLSIQDVLQDARLLNAAIKSWQARKARSIIAKLHQFGTSQTGYKINSRLSFQVLKERIAEYSDSLKQTLPIPTRIYSEILRRLTDDLDETNTVIDGALALLQDYCRDPFFARSKAYSATLARKARGETSTNRRSLNPHRPEFPELLEEYGLAAIWKKRNLTLSIKGLSYFLTQTLCRASVIIQAFTGMRGEEADKLPYHCLKQERRFGDDRIHYIVKGRVTKDPGVTRSVQWVTSSRGRDAILLAQKISGVIYKILGNPPKKKAGSTKDYYLFVTPSTVIGTLKEPKPIRVDFDNSCDLRDVLDVIIMEEDIEELDRIDGNRDWAAECIVVGTNWKLRRHQLRRSLALYAHASGLVSLPSLKRQLQHITEEMALYYCNGSPFANKFIGEDHEEKHIGVEWRETKPVSEGLAYIANVLLADQNDLFGPHVLWNRLHRTDENGIMLVDREETLKAFKKGQLAYRETPLGGCGNPDPCNKEPLTILHIGCLQEKCKHMIGSFSRIERLIKIKEVQVGKLNKVDPLAFETKVDSEELRVLRIELEAAKAKAEIAKKRPA